MADLREQLHAYIHDARNAGETDSAITEELVLFGWSRAIIERALEGKTLPPIAPWRGDGATSAVSSGRKEPIAVVQNLSTRGYEYYLMFIGLWGTLISTLVIAHMYINSMFSDESRMYSDGYSYDTDSEYTFWITVLVVCLPVFAYFFRRLMLAEKRDPLLRKDPSRKKLIQTTQTVSFLACLVNLAIFVYALINGSSDGISIGQFFVHLLATIVVAGSTFFFYWRDEHREN